MSWLRLLTPRLALGRSFPDHVAGYYITEITGSRNQFTAGYNLVIDDNLISSVTLFEYRKEMSLIDEFTEAKSFVIGGDNYENFGERSRKLIAADGEYSALLSRYAVTTIFDDAETRVASDTYIVECGSKFIKIRSSFPALEIDLASAKFDELMSNLRLNV